MPIVYRDDSAPLYVADPVFQKDFPFGDFLREKRKEKGYSQKELARLVGISEMSIRRYESQERRPKLDDFVKLGRLLGFVEVLDNHISAEDARILDILRLLRNLNTPGLQKALSMVELLNEVPRLQKTPTEKQADQWRTEDEFMQHMLQTEREERYAELNDGYQEQLQAEQDAAYTMPEI